MIDFILTGSWITSTYPSLVEYFVEIHRFSVKIKLTEYQTMTFLQTNRKLGKKSWKFDSYSHFFIVTHYTAMHISNLFSTPWYRRLAMRHVVTSRHFQVKSTFSLLFWHKILIPNFKCYCHEALCMSQHTGSHKNSLNLLSEKYLNESHWPMRRIRLLECTYRTVTLHFRFQSTCSGGKLSYFLIWHTSRSNHFAIDSIYVNLRYSEAVFSQQTLILCRF